MTAANGNTATEREDEEEILSLAMAGAPSRVERNGWTAYNLMKSSYFNKLHLVSHVLRIKYDKWCVHAGDAIWCSSMRVTLCWDRLGEAAAADLIVGETPARETRPQT